MILSRKIQTSLLNAFSFLSTSNKMVHQFYRAKKIDSPAARDSIGHLTLSFHLLCRSEACGVDDGIADVKR